MQRPACHHQAFVVGHQGDGSHACKAQIFVVAGPVVAEHVYALDFQRTDRVAPRGVLARRQRLAVVVPSVPARDEAVQPGLERFLPCRFAQAAGELAGLQVVDPDAVDGVFQRWGHEGDRHRAALLRRVLPPRRADAPHHAQQRRPPRAAHRRLLKHNTSSRDRGRWRRATRSWRGTPRPARRCATVRRAA